MARSDIYTLIPLDRAAAILGIDPYHFNSILTLMRPENTACDDVWLQAAWQRYGQASRDDLAIALKSAEDLTTKYLGYSPVPRWFEDEEKLPAKPFAVELTNIRSINARGAYKSVRTNSGYVIEFGKKTKSLVEAGATITYSDGDGDGYAELATVNINTVVTEPQEIRAYFPDESGTDSWEIRPITISITSGVATITFPKYLVPLPNKWIIGPTADDPRWRAIDGDNAANFVETVDVYRVYTAPAEQATFYHSAALCTEDDEDGDGFVTGTGRLKLRDSRLGLVSYEPATWDTDDSKFVARCNAYPDPERMLISYRAGFKSPDVIQPLIQMDALWERAIVYYAFTLLDRASNICDNTQNIYEHMSEDLALSEGQRSFSLSFKDMQNPLGTTRAAIKLWRMIEQYRLV